MGQRMPTYEIKLQTRWHTLITLGIHSELVPGTLIYVGIRGHTSEAVEFFLCIHIIRNVCRSMNTLEVRTEHVTCTRLIRCYTSSYVGKSRAILISVCGTYDKRASNV